ncbi:hypothetical protein M9H77_17748 [Catharanthus roseus]|uniref:Uncharacterized protein n=1 Tax=Catharanthus roseus TaxID=4058 RepID=A0ACC0B5F7_CATRO|nr:hypothetical protein M9H77_17748 [Catharanthus roseus]
MMEAKSKQENYQSKLARDMNNFHHGGGNGVNAYGGNNHGNGSFTSKRHNGVDNFSSSAKSYGHILLMMIMGKELGNYLEHLPIRPFLNPSLSFHEAWKTLKDVQDS